MLKLTNKVIVYKKMCDQYHYHNTGIVTIGILIQIARQMALAKSPSNILIHLIYHINYT